MSRLLLVMSLVVALTLATSSAATAFHHGGVPGDECAPAQAGTPGSNPTARDAIRAHNPAQTPPLPPVGTPGDAATPSTCPAPQK
jgi:hypothetical protein